MNRRRILALTLLSVSTTACFHAVIDTGLPPGAQTIAKPWAHSFVYGLVPPAPIDASNVCRAGVAKVETQHSFLNGLVAGLTWSLYTPISIQVTCAADRGARQPGDSSNEASPQNASTALRSVIRFDRKPPKTESHARRGVDAV
jgi:hypothetical protein